MKIVTVKDMKKEYPIGSQWLYCESPVQHNIKILNITRRKQMIWFKMEATSECKTTKVGQVFDVAFHQTCGMGGYCPWHLLPLPIKEV